MLVEGFFGFQMDFEALHQFDFGRHKLIDIFAFDADFVLEFFQAGFDGQQIDQQKFAVESFQITLRIHIGIGMRHSVIIKGTNDMQEAIGLSTSSVRNWPLMPPSLMPLSRPPMSA